MSWVTIIRGKDISKHAEGGAGSGILLTSATPLHASLVCGTSTMARTAGGKQSDPRVTCGVSVLASGFGSCLTAERARVARSALVRGVGGAGRDAEPAGGRAGDVDRGDADRVGRVDAGRGPGFVELVAATEPGRAGIEGEGQGEAGRGGTAAGR